LPLPVSPFSESISIIKAGLPEKSGTCPDEHEKMSFDSDGEIKIDVTGALITPNVKVFKCRVLAEIGNCT
jgi:hypothetical protein